MSGRCWRGRTIARFGRRRLALGGAVLAQVALGIWTLLAQVPLSLGLAHQAGAVDRVRPGAVAPARAADGLGDDLAPPPDSTTLQHNNRPSAGCPAGQLGRPRWRRRRGSPICGSPASTGRSAPGCCCSRPGGARRWRKSRSAGPIPTSGISRCSGSAPSSCAAPAAPITTSSTATTTPASRARRRGPFRRAR